MGFVRKLGLLSATLVSLVVSACTQTSDPASPCRATDYGRSTDATFVTPAHAPIVAVTAEQPFVLQQVCDAQGCTPKKTYLVGLASGSTVLLTGDGDWLVAIDPQGHVFSYEVTATSVEPAQEGWTDFEERPAHLVASLRGSEIVVSRDARGRLQRYIPGKNYTELLAEGIEDMLVVGVGERYLVGRRIHDGDDESLWLVPVHPDLRYETPVELARGETFSRVMLTPGDELVVATTGEGDDAETLVFGVPDGRLRDRFEGAAVSGRAPREELPGLRSISPDGSAVAYRTPTGALALRSLDTQSSCLVRSSTAGDHRLAGFAANGVLYMEASEGAGRTQVLAFDPVTRRLAALGQDQEGYRLAAVPAQRTDEPLAGVDQGRDETTAWAIAVKGGNYAALQEGAPPESLALSQVSFMARDDGAVWLLDNRKTAVAANGKKELALLRIAPSRSSASRTMEFSPAAEAGPEWVDVNGNTHDSFVTTLTPGRDVCVSTGVPGAWAYHCGRGESSQFFESDSGATEDPDQSDVPDIPDPSN